MFWLPWVTQDGGPVTVTAQVLDPNTSDSHHFDWSLADNVLLASLSSVQNVQQFQIDDPSVLGPDAYYKIGVRVSDDGNPALQVQDERYIKVLTTGPALNGDDSDADGVDDASEGYGDDDDDNIPNYADAYDLDDDESELIPGKQGHHDTWLVSVQPGTRVRLGPMAQQSERHTVHVTAEEIRQYAASFSGGIAADPVDTFDNVGGYFDFEIDDIAKPGDSVHVVLPLHAAIPDNAVYRKYFVFQGWQSFVPDLKNKIYSAPGDGNGLCPATGSDRYSEGLTAGHWCVQLLIEDGGANDSDAGGIATAAASQPGPSTPAPEATGGGGGGSFPVPFSIGLLLLWLLKSRSYRAVSIRRLG